MPEHVARQQGAQWQHRGVRSLGSYLRDASVAFASAGVLGLLVLYAVAGPSARLTASIGPVVPRPGSSAVVEGRVLDSSGGGLRGARVDVRKAGRHVGSAESNDAGAFRVELNGPCTVYDISVRARAVGSTVKAAAQRQLCPGDALPMDLRVVTQGHFLWIPGPR